MANKPEETEVLSVLDPIEEEILRRYFGLRPRLADAALSLLPLRRIVSRWWMADASAQAPPTGPMGERPFFREASAEVAERWRLWTSESATQEAAADHLSPGRRRRG